MIHDYAIGQLRLPRDEFYRLSLGDYTRICYGVAVKEISEMRKLRTLLGAISGKDLRGAMPLPGDWDHVPLDTPEYQQEVLKHFGVLNKWKKNKC